MNHNPIHIIGGGLAGSEAAWQAAEAGVPVILHEMRPVRGTDAHKTDGLAELVCSNSFRSDDAETNAVGLLHAEMRLAGSLIMAAGDANQVPAGGALAVDRDGFSAAVTAKLEAHPLITDRARGGRRPAAGRLGSGDHRHRPADRAVACRRRSRQETGADALAFFDAIAPIVHFDTIDMDICWFQSRYDKVGPGGTGKDYINCPMDKAQYEAFVAGADRRRARPSSSSGKARPISTAACRSRSWPSAARETLRHGPMKPMGLTNAHNPTVKAYAVVQLRQDNALGTLYNMVGFQTKLKHGEQVRIFRTIPGLENAEFARLGGLHRNTYINSPTLLDGSLQLKSRAGPALRRPDHRLRGLCRERRDRPARGPFRGRRAAGRACQPAAADDRVRRAARPHHRRPHRVRRRAGQAVVPADEHQFRPVSAAGAGHEPQAGWQGRFRGKDKTVARRRAVTSRALADCRAWLGLPATGRGGRIARPADSVSPSPSPLS